MQNLREKIYLLTYGKPRYKSEISKLLYGEDVKQIYPMFKKLESPGIKWIKKVNYKENKEDDGRSKSRIYYQANAEPLFDSICQDLKDMQEKISALDENSHMRKNMNRLKWKSLELTADEKKKLRNLLGHGVFREYVYGISKTLEETYGFKGPFFNFSMIKSQLSNYCAFLFFIECARVRIEIESSSDEFMDIFTRTFKRHGAKKNFKDISEGILSLGFILIEKLTYLDYRTSSTLMSYLLEMVKTFPKIPHAMLDETPLSNFSPSELF